MKSVAVLLDHPVVLKLGLALLHFLWQGAALAVVALLLLTALRHAKPNARYLALMIVLAALVAAPVATFVVLSQGQSGTGITSSARLLGGSPAPDPGTGAASVSASSSAGASTSLAAANAASGRVAVLRTVLTSWHARTRGWLGAHLAWIAAGWLIGVLVLSLRLLLGWVGVARAKRTGVPPAGGEWRTILANLAERLRVSRSVRLLESAVAEVPTVIGWLRPVILLPTSALTGLTREQIEALIAHELAHIRRGDYLVNVLQTVVETLLFYHPAVWWVSDRLRVEREHCCDDLAVACCGGILAYARALTAMESLRSAPQPALTARGGSLLMRIRRLADVAALPPKRAPSWPAGALALAAIVFMGIGFQAMTARATQPAHSLRLVLRVNRPTYFEFRAVSSVPDIGALRARIEAALVSPRIPAPKVQTPRDGTQPGGMLPAGLDSKTKAWLKSMGYLQGSDGFVVESSAADENAFAAQAVTVTHLAKVAAPDLSLTGKRMGQVSPELLEAVRAVVEKRARIIDSEAQVDAKPPREIAVSLRAGEDPRSVAAALTAPGVLEFRAVPSKYDIETEVDSASGRRIEVFADKTGKTVLTERVLAQSPVVLRGDALGRNARVDTPQPNLPVVVFELNNKGSERFYQYTSTHKRRVLAIVLDGRLISAPVIMAPIRRRGVIEGLNSIAEAQALVIALNSAPLPAGLEVISSEPSTAVGSAQPLSAPAVERRMPQRPHPPVRRTIADIGSQMVKDFSADWRWASRTDERAVVGRIYMKGARRRLDLTSEGRASIIIDRMDKGLRWELLPATKIYSETPDRRQEYV